MAQFSLSWDAHKQNICSGLSSLQQNGEFVDMTLAADGHHVKVHQMVLSLVSPYIKELIASANCPHPIIFLNKMSYASLCAILEYIYTGEVMVARENLPALIEAGKELHIKGLQDMKLELSTQNMSEAALATFNSNEAQPLSERLGYKSKEKSPSYKYELLIEKTTSKKKKSQAMPILDADEYDSSHALDDVADHSFDDTMETDNENEPKTVKSSENQSNPIQAQIVYTLSNQGALQMILNRYIYNLTYTSRTSDGRRNWRCAAAWVHGKRCLAKVFTKHDVVVRRHGVHSHPYHDKRIMKKVRDHMVFNAINDAEERGNSIKRQKPDKPKTTAKKATDADTTDAE